MNNDERKQYNATKKRESRARRSAQKMRRDKESDRVRKIPAPSIVFDKTPNASFDMVDTGETSSSRASRYRHFQKVKSQLPNSPRAYSKTIKYLVDTATPRKRHQLSQHKVVRCLESELISSGIKDHISSLRVGTEKTRKQLRYIASLLKAKHGFKTKLANKLGISRKLIGRKQHDRKKRKDAISDDTKEVVADFWRSSEISRILPLKKRAKKGKPTYLLEHTYTAAYRMYKAKHPNTKIGYCTFIKLKPGNVRQIRYKERMVCCCKMCENCKLMLNALNNTVQQGLEHLVINDIAKVAGMVLCSNVSEQCLENSCKNCTNLTAHYQPLIDQHGNGTVSYREWVYKPYTSQKTGKVSKVLHFQTKESKIIDLVQIFSKDSSKLGSHLFRAKWQQEQFSLSHDVMPPKSAVMVMDFSENYSCSLQDEVQSYHWSQSQITIHPMVAYVNGSDEVGKPTHIESYVAISDDLAHDSAAVEMFASLAEGQLKRKHKITKIVQFTDCCAVQYRCKTVLADISTAELETERNYFEASHGKSPSDGLGAVIKNAATRAVTHRKVVIVNAKDMYAFCQENLTTVGDGVFPSKMKAAQNSSRTFFLVQTNEINHRNNTTVRGMKGIMKVHSVKQRSPYIVASRHLSCFCSFCYLKEGDRCQNNGVVGGWKDFSLKPTRKCILENILMENINILLIPVQYGTGICTYNLF